MRSDRYVLDEKQRPVVERDLHKWARWMEDTDRHVGDTRWGPEITIPESPPFRKERKAQQYRVSTVFLGLDHRFGVPGPPILWESMVFAHGMSFDNDCRRCAGSIEQAHAMHEEMVAWVKQQIESTNDNGPDDLPERSPREGNTGSENASDD